jgi:hypothetical protein
MEGTLLPEVLHDSAVSLRKAFPPAARGELAPREVERLVRRVLREAEDLFDIWQDFQATLRRGLEGGRARDQFRDYLRLFQEWVEVLEMMEQGARKTAAAWRLAAIPQAEGLPLAAERMRALLADAQALLRAASSAPPPVTPQLLQALEQAEEEHRRGA